MDRGHTSSARPPLPRRIVRRGAFGVASLALAAGGIAVNLSILGNNGWGPGGLTLGAAGVARADVASAPDLSTASSIAPRKPAKVRPSSQVGPSSDVTTTTTQSNPRRPQTFTSPTAQTTPTAEPTDGSVAPAPTTTTSRNPRSTTTTSAPGPGVTQTFSPAAGVRITATTFDEKTLNVTVKFANGWSGDTKRSGTNVRMRFRNDRFVIEWHGWVEDGKIKRSYERIPIDD